MQLTIISKTGEALHTVEVLKPVPVKELVQSLMTGQRAKELWQTYGVTLPSKAYTAGKRSWEIEVKGVDQTSGEVVNRRFCRTIKL